MVVNRSPVLRFILTALVIALPVVAFAGPVGKAVGGGASIEWQLSVSGHDRVVLTISAPDGEVYTKEYPAGKPVSLSLKDIPGAGDGVYGYQLTVMPKISKGLQQQLENARKANDNAAAKAALKAAGIGEAAVQSGAFTVSNGSIVDPNLQEANAQASMAPASIREEGPAGRTGGSTSARPGTPVVNDQVIPDDLIVQGSGCFGFDCVNNESFGFDTIRLKENNLRIKAEDTSVGSFPTNDWQLTFNDSASGGSSKFSVEDITGSKVPMTITAGATTNSIFVDSTGRVGFRTSTPVLDLHVNTSNTPAIRLEQNSSGGFTAQTWDIAGNEANFFVRDVTGGSKLSFRIRPGAPTSSLDISADGDVGVGTASPSDKLHVSSSLAATTGTGLMVENTSGTGAGRRLMNLQNNGQVIFRMKDTAQTPEWTFTASNAFQIDNTADAGIELQVNPDGALLVNGTQMTVPDYVFGEDYKLMPINELAAFVKENRHLPNVPNSEMIKQNGLNLSRFPLDLLEKVEELALYTINQHEQIQALKAQVEELKKQVEQK